MNFRKKTILGISLALAVIGLATVQAQPQVGYWDSSTPVNSALNTKDYSTNSYYPRTIDGGTTASATVWRTNIVPVFLDNKDPYVSIQCDAAAMADTGATNTVTFLFYAATKQVTITNATTGTAGTIKGSRQSAGALTPWLTAVVPLSGATTVSTNAVCTKGAIPNIYLYAVGVASGAVLTNYSVSVTSTGK